MSDDIIRPPFGNGTVPIVGQPTHDYKLIDYGMRTTETLEQSVKAFDQAVANGDPQALFGMAPGTPPLLVRFLWQRMCKFAEVATHNFSYIAAKLEEQDRRLAAIEAKLGIEPEAKQQQTTSDDESDAT